MPGDDDKLDHSEVDFVRRAMLLTDRNPDDEELFDEYARVYLDMAKRMRFCAIDPASSSLQ